MKKLTAIIAAAGLLISGCAAEDSGETYQSLKAKNEKQVTEITGLYLDDIADEFWESTRAGELSQVEARDMVTASYVTDLLDKYGKWSWDEVVESIRAEHEFQPLADLDTTRRADIKHLSDTSVEVTVNSVYLVRDDLTSVPSRVHCDTYETWVFETGTWKLDAVDTTLCDYRLSLS